MVRGRVTSFSLELLLAAILERGGGGYETEQTRLLPAATPPDFVVSLTTLLVSVTLSFLWSRIVSPVPNPQP